MKRQVIALLLFPALLLAAFALPACTGRTDAQAVQAEPPDESPEQSMFRFTRENFPRLDGSTSLVPLGEAVASVLLGEPREEVQDLLDWHKTTASFLQLRDGGSDLLLVSEPDPAVFDELTSSGLDCRMEPICTEALVFITNRANPVDSLTPEELRAVYSGKITNWKELGGEDAPIVAFQRNKSSGSQVLMQKLVMGDTPMMQAPVDLLSSAMGELIELVRSYDNAANALGYTVYYYAHDMEMAHDLKILKVDGVAADRETIRSGAYPFCSPYYCAIRADAAEDSPERVLMDWLLSDAGQALIEREGYVSVRDRRQP